MVFDEMYASHENWKVVWGRNVVPGGKDVDALVKLEEVLQEVLQDEEALVKLQEVMLQRRKESA
jgi:hypothetical protein